MSMNNNMKTTYRFSRSVQTVLILLQLILLLLTIITNITIATIITIATSTAKRYNTYIRNAYRLTGKTDSY